MPLDEKILGFSNRWYRAAMEAATMHHLLRDLEIRVVTAPYFLATKLEAFRGRGRGDFLASHDLEDLIFVIDGRSTIVDEYKQRHPCFASTSTQKSPDCWTRPDSSTPYPATYCPMLRVKQESGHSYDD